MLVDFSYAGLWSFLKVNRGRIPENYDINLELEVDYKGAHGTYLQVACGAKDVKMVMWLVPLGANVTDAVSQDNVLHWACRDAEKENRPDLVAFLLSFERIRDLVNTPLSNGDYLVHVSHSSNVMRMLIAAGARVDVLNRHGMTALMIAAKCGHLHVLKLLLPLGDTVHIHAEFQKTGHNLPSTALHFACLSDQAGEKCVRLLLEYGARVNKGTAEGVTPLMFAVRSVSLPKIQVLLNAGADMSDVNIYGGTLLHWSFTKWSADHGRMFTFLLKNDAVVMLLNKRNNNGETPIFFANKAETAKLLVVAGSGVNDIAYGSTGRTVLMDACEYYDDNSFVKYLLPLVDDVNRCIKASDGDNSTVFKNSVGETALHIASRYAEASLVAILLNAGASVNSQNCDGYTPLQIAVAFNNLAVVRLLVGRGSDLSHVAEEGDETLLHSVCFRQSGFNECAAIVTFLLKSEDVRATVNSVMRMKAGHVRTALMLTESAVVANQLVTAGACVNPEMLDGWTFLMDACHRNSLEMVTWLLPRLASMENLSQGGISALKRVAPWDVVRKGNTALHIASGGKDACIVHALLEAGAAVDCFDEKGRTPLHKACVSSSAAVVRALLQHGANVNAISAKAMSPLHFTAMSTKQCAEKVSILLAAGVQIDVKDKNGKVALELTNNDDVRQMLREEMWKRQYIYSIGLWRPNRHIWYPRELKLVIRTVQILARARPRLSLNSLMMFRKTGELPVQFPKACLHMLPDELIQYLHTFITNSFSPFH